MGHSTSGGESESTWSSWWGIGPRRSGGQTRAALVSRPRRPSADMASLLDNVTNGIWHAFNALHRDNYGLVHKSKLKVLTANIGTLLDLYGVERGLDHYRSTLELDFEHFKYYLHKEVFSTLSDTFSSGALRNFEEKIEEVCWLICRKHYIQRQRPIFSENSTYQIFRIFCMLADLIPDKDNPRNFQVLLSASEAGMVAEQLVNLLGLRWDQSDWENFSTTINAFKLNTFLAILESKCRSIGNLEEASITEAVEELYQTFIKDVIKKGFLMKKGYLLPTLREYWFVLQPYEISYYKTPSEKYLCGTISITPNSSLESFQGSAKLQKFQLTTSERVFELATQDHKSRLQWISALQLAIEHSSGKYGYHRSLKAKRKEENKKRELHIEEVNKTKKLLQEEMKARIAAEIQAHQLAEMAQEDSKRLQEMKDTQAKLEKLLAEETQAKQDEEIVRALQARVLTEEWEKREELERLQEEQRQMLATETLKRKQFEQLQKAKEKELREAENKIKEIEKKKETLDEELRLARNKIRHSEESQQLLEEKLVVLCPNSKEGDKIRRAVSFMPSPGDRTVPLLQARAATLRRHSKKENNNIIITEFDSFKT